MRDVLVDRRDPTEERRTFAPNPPADAIVLDGDVRLIDRATRAVVAIQAVARPEPWLVDLARSLRVVKFAGAKDNQGDEVRLSGFKNAHRTFGHSAPVPLRRRYGCSVCQFNREYPRITNRLATFVDVADMMFQAHAPGEHAAHAEVLEQIDEAWRFAGAPWTSGIINRTSALPYHRDAGNLVGSWSAMLCLRRATTGGLLHLAEWGVHLTIPDRSVTLFDGQAVLHAVTPFTLTHPGAYRYTIVAYAKAAMRTCLTGDDEVRRAQRRRADAEDREAAVLAAKRAEATA